MSHTDARYSFEEIAPSAQCGNKIKTLYFVKSKSEFVTGIIASHIKIGNQAKD